MKNIDRIAQHIAKTGARNMLIHSICGTEHWIVCEKIEADKWLLSLLDPMGNSVYHLGSVTSKQHLDLWEQLVRREINIKASAIARAKELKQVIKNFLKYSQVYAKFTKKFDSERRTYRNRRLKTQGFNKIFNRRVAAKMSSQIRS